MIRIRDKGVRHCKVEFFFFQAEDGIRDRSPSRGLGDVYKETGVMFNIY